MDKSKWRTYGDYKDNTNKFEYYLVSIKDEHQKRTRPNLHHPIYNERHEEIIELIDWTLEKYKETAVIQHRK